MMDKDQDTKQEIFLFRSLFKGREDVFAIRWEKAGKSGYMPSFIFDPFRYKAHQLKGGSFQNFKEKKYQPLTDGQVTKHLAGEIVLGIYPLLPDNNSWFIAADFDGAQWVGDSKRFLVYARNLGLSVYLERSRSGNGGHVWMFLDQPYPAYKSRKVFQQLLIESRVISIFDKNSSFDRLFPNQDTLSGKGLGNLIALPLNKKSLDEQNSCFIDPETLLPFPDQWKFLNEICRTSIQRLDAIFHSKELQKSVVGQSPATQPSDILTITLSNDVRLNKNAIPLILTNFLIEELNYANEEYFLKKNIGRNVHGTTRYFRLIEEAGNEVIIPKGFVGKLLRFCKDNHINCKFSDDRIKLNPVNFNFQAELKFFQEPAIETAGKKDLGIIVAPPGSGKTIIALKIISDKKQPALIIVHRKQLLDQWKERIESFLGIPRQHIGTISNGKWKPGNQITIATIQSLAKESVDIPTEKITQSFGTIIIDECHHIPAETFRKTIQKFNSYYLYGLTATPFRKYNDAKMIFIFLGEVIREIKPADAGNIRNPVVVIRNTSLNTPFNPKIDEFEILSKILVHDTERNRMIIQDIVTEVGNGKRVVVLTERKDHIDVLYLFLKQRHEVVTLSGEDSDARRSEKWKLLQEGNYQVLITTGQFFGEGTDLRNASCLFLVYPFSFEGKLIQYIGRVQRSEITPTIYDYRDIRIDYLNKMFLKRNVYYRKLVKQTELFKDPVETSLIDQKPPSGLIIIDSEIKVPIEILEFMYGSVAFSYEIKEVNRSVEFEMEQIEIRPEFEVLKPYFAKALKSKYISVSIFAEFENQKLVSMSASSEDLNKINREVIESVRFRFFTQPLYGNRHIHTDHKNPVLQSEHPLSESGETLLQEMLAHNKFKHHKHLRFLSEKHAAHILKVRFVLQPFSFVFLIEGEKEFHIILETLDTEEASYLWHCEKQVSALPNRLAEIDSQLSIIRNNGRQKFLAEPPENFSRIVHDYSDDMKGFIIWKDALEEQLI